MLRSVSFLSIIICVTAARADVVNLVCTQKGPTDYTLSYTFTGNTHQVQIFAGTNPDPADTAMEPILKTGDNTVTVHAGQPGQRAFFFLKADTGETREVSIRHLPLQGTPNFRDLGGYESTDGRFVRWGLIYRAGVLTYLTAKDYAYLGQMGVRVVCDFRTHQENQDAPETWIPSADVEHISLPIGTDDGGNATAKSLFEGHPTADQLRARMDEVYLHFATAAAPQFSGVFKALEQQHLPLLYHCTAGKDRTGVFSAFLLLTLGVPKKTVLEDYALTNRYLLDQPESEGVKRMTKSSSANGMAGLTPEQMKVLMAADPEYLESALQAINAKWGSFDNYRRQELHVSDQDTAALRDKLLMP